VLARAKTTHAIVSEPYGQLETVCLRDCLFMAPTVTGINDLKGYRVMARFAGRTVLVTGASRGIGLATAQRFHMEGARVGLVGRDADRLASVVADLDGSCRAVSADVAVPGECVRAVDEIEEALGPVDVLVSNAGVLRRDFLSDVSVDDFEESYRVNVGAALWLTQRVLPGMRERGYGRIVLVASELGLFGGRQRRPGVCRLSRRCPHRSARARAPVGADRRCAAREGYVPRLSGLSDHPLARLA